MKRTLFKLNMIAALAVVITSSLLVYGQGTSYTSLNGTVMDPNGAVVPGASVAVKHNDTAAEFRAVTANNGTFSIPSLAAGTYTVTITATGFKQSVVSGVKLDAGTPGNVKVNLEIGAAIETVTVQGGGEVLQTQSATVSSTLQVKQIAQLPLVSRNALDFLILLPGVNTTGAPRNSRINGLPAGTINIMIDGINTQDANLKASDGFFSYVNPRLDAVEEVTVSTATPGSESAGQGAVQIKFTTRSGNNQYHGSLYEYHRNTALNANYWFSNRDLAPVNDETHLPCTTFDPKNCHAPRNRVLLNQFGGRIGGPISLPKKLFGRFGFDGHDKAFFFVNFEEFRLPQSITRNRTILTPQAQAGIFSYNVTTNGVITTRTVNLLQLAAANGQTSTIDPVVGKLLSDIRGTTTPAAITALTDPNTQRFTFLSGSSQARYFPTTRLDFNLTSKHHLEGSWNYNYYTGSPDLLNSADPAFPGFPSFGAQNSNRFATSTALRSTLTPTLVNEARFAFNGGTVLFFANAMAADFNGPLANQAGFALGISAAGITNASVVTNPSRRNAPIKTWGDTVTWTRGAHSFSFGGTFTNTGHWQTSDLLVPSISFGVDTSLDPAAPMFNTTNFQGASTANLTAARNLYATLTGRITQIAANAVLSEKTSKYVYNGSRVQRGRMREFGFFGQDSWRARPNLTLNYGLRWEIQLPFVPLNDSFSTVSIADMYGVSGNGNLFKPGTLTGRETQFVQYKKGTKSYNLDKNNIAPSFGFAWSVNAKDGWLKRLLGDSGQTVVRGGYSIAYNAPGMFEFTNRFDGNPGATLSATRNQANGNLTGGALGGMPILLRETSRLGAPSFPSAPTYPIAGAPVVTVSNSAEGFDPNIQVPYTQSWSFGLQREITKDMAIEVRYVGNVNLQQWADYNLNSVESNIFENGFLNEFKLAQANLYANIAAGRGNTFAYFGTGTGTSPLPLSLAYFAGIAASGAGTASNYSNASSSPFRDAAILGDLARTNPDPLGYVSNMNTAARRQNALNAGLAANFIRTNPGLTNATFTGNGGYSRYDSMQVELKRRLSKGLLVGASYVWAKNFTRQRPSFRTDSWNGRGDVLAHAFKANWQYELPFGRGKMFLGNAGGLVDRLVGGWEWQGTARIQSGNLFSFGGLQLVGITEEELRKNFKLRFDDANKIVYNLPQDIIDNSRRAFNPSATDPTGYSTLGVPTGRYLAPASGATCTEVISGDCTRQQLIVTGPQFTRFDLSLIKRFKFNERANFEFRAEFLNAFNYVNFFGTASIGGTTSSQTTSAYQDINNTQDPGGRLIQFVLRINF